MSMPGALEDARQELLSQLDRYEQDGVTRVNWLTTQDDQVCPLCASREKKRLNLSEAKRELAGTFCQPMAPNERCRCTLTVVEGQFDEMP
ncbi:MAG: hypothetical protein ACREOH_24520 [Candidatus Entotheonellia bacterium]